MTGGPEPIVSMVYPHFMGDLLRILVPSLLELIKNGEFDISMQPIESVNKMKVRTECNRFNNSQPLLSFYFSFYA